MIRVVIHVPQHFHHNEISCAASLLGALLEVQERMDCWVFDPAKCTVGGKHQEGCLHLVPINAPPYECALPPVSIQIVKSIRYTTAENEGAEPPRLCVIHDLVGAPDFFLQEILKLSYGTKR